MLKLKSKFFVTMKQLVIELLIIKGKELKYTTGKNHLSTKEDSESRRKK